MPWLWIDGDEVNVVNGGKFESTGVIENYSLEMTNPPLAASAVITVFIPPDPDGDLDAWLKGFHKPFMERSGKR